MKHKTPRQRCLLTSLLVFLFVFALAVIKIVFMPSPRQVNVAPNRSFKLSLGQTAFLPNSLQFQFSQVLNDSRCPEQAQCLEAGNVDIQILFATSQSTTPVTLNYAPGGQSQAYSLGDYDLSLIDLAPAQPETGAIASSDYRATFMLTPSL